MFDVCASLKPLEISPYDYDRDRVSIWGEKNPVNFLSEIFLILKMKNPAHVHAQKY